MNGRKPISKRRRFRFKALLWVLGAVVVAGAGGAWLYVLQRERNTQRLKTRAEHSAEASDWSEAANSYRQYLNRRPDDVEALAAYADVLVTLTGESPEQLGNCIRVLQRLVRAQPENVKALKDLTGAYLLVSEHTLAEDTASQWAARDAHSAEAVVSLATARRGLRKYEAALEALRKGVERMPGEPSLYPPIIALYTVELNQPEEGKAWLDRALEAAPGAYAVQLAAFAYYNTRGDAAQAEAHLRRALEAAPDEASVLLPAASYYTERGALAEAKEYLDRMAARSPENQRMLIALAAWASKGGDPAVMTETARQLEERIGDRNPDILARAAELYLAARRTEDADRCIARLEGVANPGPTLQTWISGLRGAREVVQGRPYGAVAHLEAVLRKQPNDAHTLELLGRSYLEMGAFESAADAYRRLLVLSPESAAVRIMLARLELQLGRDGAAMGLIAAVPGATAAQQEQVELVRLACDLRRALTSAPSDLQRQDMRERLRRMVARPPGDELSARMLCICLALTGYPAEVSEELRARLADEATGAAVAEEYAAFLLATRRLDEARRVIEELEGRGAAVEAARRLKVKWLAAAENAGKAREFIAEVRAQGRAVGDLYVALGDQCAELGRRDEAREAYLAAAGELPESIPLWQQVRRLAITRDQALEVSEKIKAIEGDAGLTWRMERALALLAFSPDATAAREAADLLQQCVDQRKDWPAAFVSLGNAREGLGEWAAAAQAYQTAINQQPGLASGGVALRLVAVLNRQGRFVEADVVLERVLEANPKSPDALALLLEKNIRTQSLAAAAETADRLLAARPADAGVAALVADLMLQQGNVTRADEVVTAGLQNHPEAVGLQWSRVRVLLAQKKDDDARLLAQQIAQREGTARDFWFLGQVHEQLGDAAEAEGAVRRAIELAPQDAQLLTGVAEFWRLRGDRARQVEMARKAVAARGGDAQAEVALAELLVGEGASPAEQREAAEIVARRLAANPDDPRALTLDALLAGTREPPDLDHAFKQLQKALSIHPRQPKAHQLLGAVQIRRGDMKGAQEAISAGLAQDADNIDLLLLSAEVHGYRGDYEQAMIPLRRVLELRPRFPAALRLLPGAAERANQVDRAIKLVESGAGQAAMTAEESVALARLHESKGETARAEALYQQAVGSAPQDSSIFQLWLHFQARQGAYERLYELAEQRQAEHPDDVLARLAAGHLLGLQSEARLREKGIGWLMAVASSHPSLAGDAVYRAGVCHLQAGDVAQAESAFLQSAQLAPTSAEPVNALAWLYSEEMNRPADALGVLQKFLSAGGRETPQMLDTHGAVLLRLGQLEAARAKLLACIDAAGQTDTLTAATFRLGKLLFQQKKQTDAVAQLRRAQELDRRFGGLNDRERAEIEQLLNAEGRAATP